MKVRFVLFVLGDVALYSFVSETLVKVVRAFEDCVPRHHDLKPGLDGQPVLDTL